MTDVLDLERANRFRTIRDDLLKKRDAVCARLDNMRELRIVTERQLRELDKEIGTATRHLRHSERSIAEYIADIVREHDEGRGYFAKVLAEANARKNLDILEQTQAVVPKGCEP